MKNTIKFDYIISNPPYKIGNIITKSVIDNVNFDNFINLMPINCYKAKDVYKHIIRLEVVDPKAFEDANVQDNLCICNLAKYEKEQVYSDLIMQTYKQYLVDFYILNYVSNSNSFVVGPIATKLTKAKEEYSQETDFYVTLRTCGDGVHSLDGKSSIDVEWNLKRKPKEELWPKMEWIVNGVPSGLKGLMIMFKSSTAKDNFCRFWYKNPLMNDLIKGLNKSGGTCRDAIPNIDYSIDRDYEHLTLEDIMKILREETPDAN